MIQTTNLSEARVRSAGAALISSLNTATLGRFHELRQRMEATRRLLWCSAELDEHIRTLEELIFSVDDHGLLAYTFLCGLCPHLVALQQVAYCRWETWLEQRLVEGLDDLSGIDDYVLAPRFRRLLEREVELLETKSPKRVLFIGSGPVPISAVLLHEYLGTKVDCIDTDSLAVAQSRKLLQRLSLSDHVRVEVADGMRVDASSYDAVLIALLAKPKRDILMQIAATAPGGCQIICRASVGLRTLLYESMDPLEDLRDFRIAAQRLAVQPGDTISSMLLVRRDS